MAQKACFTIYLPDKLHAEVEERGTFRVLVDGAGAQNGRPFAVLPGGVLTGEGWEHVAVPEDEMLLKSA